MIVPLIIALIFDNLCGFATVGACFGFLAITVLVVFGMAFIATINPLVTTSLLISNIVVQVVLMLVSLFRSPHPLMNGAIWFLILLVGAIADAALDYVLLPPSIPDVAPFVWRLVAFVAYTWITELFLIVETQELVTTSQKKSVIGAAFAVYTGVGRTLYKGAENFGCLACLTGCTC